MLTTTTPTPTQISQAQTNLANMQTYNQYVYNHGSARITNAYMLLTEVDNSDPGLQTGINLLKKALSAAMKLPIAAATAAADPIVSKGSAFLTGMLDSWSGTPPDSLNTSFATLVLRVEATSEAIDLQLATY
ncbi:MAG TPA: hypothetical protein VGD56_18180, partial [Gemmatirosa sp.]